MFLIIKSMYRRLRSRVRDLRGNLSEGFDGYVGLRQGESLSLLLWALLLNDLAYDMESGLGIHKLTWEDVTLSLLLYADKSCVMAHSEAGLQSGLDILHRFCNDWSLTVNIQKTKVLVFSKKGVCKSSVNIFYNDGSRLEVVDLSVYLGVQLSCDGKWNETIDRLLTQAANALIGLKCKYSRFVFHPNDKYRLFLQLVEPILSYASEVWGYYVAKAMEDFHVKFLRYIL